MSTDFPTVGTARTADADTIAAINCQHLSSAGPYGFLIAPVSIDDVAEHLVTPGHTYWVTRDMTGHDTGYCHVVDEPVEQVNPDVAVQESENDTATNKPPP